jgi:hypothetical protein
VELYLHHTPIRLHDVVLIYLYPYLLSVLRSPKWSLPFSFPIKISCNVSYHPTFSVRGSYHLVSFLIEHCFIPNIQSEHKGTLHFQNDTERKCGVLRTSHLHQSTENSQSFVHTSQRLDMCSASHTADVQTIIQIVPNFVQCP